MKAIYTRAAIPLVILLVHISTATAQNIGVKKMPRQIDHSMAARSEVTLNRGLTSAYEETESGAGGRKESGFAKGDQTRRVTSSPGTSITRFLGGPKEYTERYYSNLGSEFNGQGIADDFKDYKPTPQEGLLSGQSTVRGNGPSSGIATAAGWRDKGAHLHNRQSFDGISTVATSELYGTRRSFPVGVRSSVYLGGPIYRSPW
ncbi:TPA: hypothetical protein QDB15_005671 [Burkholderia vietnamiensis]|uniref:hypothetical protein n=1 Tax=Burkholderia TaxID=32008 RepID=UPI000A494C59|nr:MULTISPECIES: hypothetical protein [Burkholderia]MBR8216449.1 hypothetical protein [Burkholderia vietnamiensis]MCA8211168.1 hypothetical protein [Burkholderia vietnamiensis]MCA8449726.1 hypothetical protein [Burkholderia vietnamiensis]MCB4348173.1 hypothetical protein [Burkholderia vietnamiensis]MDN8076493.1 hypothetical protein [Burkholderia vietnamiensis]